jgi:hypothetical protein
MFHYADQSPTKNRMGGGGGEGEGGEGEGGREGGGGGGGGREGGSSVGNKQRQNLPETGNLKLC